MRMITMENRSDTMHLHLTLLTHAVELATVTLTHLLAQAPVDQAALAALLAEVLSGQRRLVGDKLHRSASVMPRRQDDVPGAPGRHRQPGVLPPPGGKDGRAAPPVRGLLHTWGRWGQRHPDVMDAVVRLGVIAGLTLALVMLLCLWLS